jgi:hypothetical protein
MGSSAVSWLTRLPRRQVSPAVCADLPQRQPIGIGSSLCSRWAVAKVVTGEGARFDEFWQDDFRAPPYPVLGGSLSVARSSASSIAWGSTASCIALAS